MRHSTKKYDISKVKITNPIKKEDWKSRKLQFNDIEKIKQLYFLEKWRLSELSELFKVSIYCIKYNLDPDYRQRELDRVAKQHHIRWFDDKDDFKRHKIRLECERTKNLRKNNKKFANYVYVRSKQHDVENYRRVNRDNKRKYHRIRYGFRMFWNLIEKEQKRQSKENVSHE